MSNSKNISINNSKTQTINSIPEAFDNLPKFQGQMFILWGEGNRHFLGTTTKKMFDNGGDFPVVLAYESIKIKSFTKDMVGDKVRSSHLILDTFKEKGLRKIDDLWIV